MKEIGAKNGQRQQPNPKPWSNGDNDSLVFEFLTEEGDPQKAATRSEEGDNIRVYQRSYNYRCGSEPETLWMAVKKLDDESILLSMGELEGNQRVSNNNFIVGSDSENLFKRLDNAIQGRSSKDDREGRSVLETFEDLFRWGR